MTDRSSPPRIDFGDTPSGRILATARRLVLAHHYTGLTMDALARELGMSKKTLYAHFPSKDAILSTIIAITGQTIRDQADAVMARRDEGFASKLDAILTIVTANLNVVSPAFVQDLKRFAPHLHAELDAMKERNIPLIFGRIIAVGLEEGLVRRDIEVPFVVEFWLQAMKGLHQPDVLLRTGLTPREVFDRAFDLFMNGILAPGGRQDPGTGR